MPQNGRILYIDKDKDSCELLEILFSFEGFAFTGCDDPEAAMNLAKNNRYAAIVLESRLASDSGTDLCRQIREFDGTTPIVFYSASAFPADRRNGFAAGADDYLVKPNDFERLTDVVSCLAKNAEQSGRRKNQRRSKQRSVAETVKTPDVNRLLMPAGRAAAVLGVVNIISH